MNTILMGAGHQVNVGLNFFETVVEESVKVGVTFFSLETLKVVFISLSGLALLVATVTLIWFGASYVFFTKDAVETVDWGIKFSWEDVSSTRDFDSNYQACQKELEGVETFPVVGVLMDSLSKLTALFKAYGPYAPKKHRDRYYKYACSAQFLEDAKRAHVYAKNCQKEEAYNATCKRNLVNVRGKGCRTSEAWNVLGESALAYHNDKEGTPWLLLGVFTPTVAWPSIDKEFLFSDSQEMGCPLEVFSVSAPPLDSKDQPFFSYFVKDGKLDQKQYKEAMTGLANMIFSAFQADSKYKRIILPRVGQGVFLNALDEEDRKAAEDIYFQAFSQAIQQWHSAYADNEKPVELLFSSFHSQAKGDISWEGPGLEQELKAYSLVPDSLPGLRFGQIKGNVANYNLQNVFLVNAWNPSARVGNGNEASGAFDGTLGSICPAVLVATPAHNVCLQRQSAYTILA